MSSAISSKNTRHLKGLWQDARLRADSAKSTAVRPGPRLVSWRAALEDVLSVGYGAQVQSRFVDGAWEQVRWRTTPSAGALYPFEVLACILGEGNHLWDPACGRLRPCSLPPCSEEEWLAAGLATRSVDRLEALLVVVVRPWLAMKKYRQRGYPYCHLDAGHVGTNLAMYAAVLGYAPALHLRFSRGIVSDRLGLHGLCREPAVILSFASAGGRPDRRPHVDPVLPADDSAVSLEAPGSSELENWESLTGVLSFDSPPEPPRPPASMPLLREPTTTDGALIALPGGMQQPVTIMGSRSAILSRRSARGFQDQPLSLWQVATLLGALRGQGVRADCPSSGLPTLGVRLVVRNVDGLSGVFDYSPTQHAVYQVDAHAGDFHPACMMQRTATNAAALLLFHAPLEYLLGQYSHFAEGLFHAGELGQRLHLAAATLTGVGLTCIGGFDAERCAALARLDAGQEVVYVVLLGVPDDSAVKHDQLQVAFSHGYTTEEG